MSERFVERANLGSITPLGCTKIWAIARRKWRDQFEFPKRKNPRWFAGWDGVLCGWYWGEVKKPSDD